MAGEAVVGSFRGYPFSAVLWGRGARTLSVWFVLGRPVKWKTIRPIRKALPKGCSAVVQQTKLILNCSGKGEVQERLPAAMDAVTEILAAEGFTLPETCPLCRDRDRPCDALALAGGGYVPVHQDCCRTRASQGTIRAERNDLNGSYLTGFLGALLLGLAACIPSVLSVWFLDRIFALLYALIPLGAYFGYRLFQGKLNRAALPIVIGVSILALFAMEQVLFYIIIVNAYGVYPSILDTVRFYFDVMTPADIAHDMSESFLFLLLGLWITFRVIRRTNRSELRDADVLLESMAPYRGQSGRIE
jgi:hypothetical protein